MTAAGLIVELRGRGVAVWAKGGSLHYKATTQPVPVDLRAALRQCKAEVLRILTAQAAPWDPVQAKRMVNQCIETVTAVHRSDRFDADRFHAFDLALEMAFAARDLTEVLRLCDTYRQEAEAKQTGLSSEGGSR
ncbi:hypothetical protein ACFL6C_03380 [Myxococcota bacterium]